MTGGTFKKTHYQCQEAVLRDSDTVGLVGDSSTGIFKKAPQVILMGSCG